MPRYILTGAPGAGKTTLLRALAGRGFAVVEEAATEVNRQAIAVGEAEPWRASGFLDRILDLQLERLLAAGEGGLQLHDRAPACTLALALFLGRPPPARLTQAVERLAAEGAYSRSVFFVRNIGACVPTTVRRISFEESLRFEALHEQVYRDLGYELVEVPAMTVAARTELVVRTLGAASD